MDVLETYSMHILYPFTVFCVSVKPEIEPFSIIDNILNEGGSTKLFCTVSSGDLPIRFTWTKNGHLMNTNGTNLKIQQLDDLTSMFSLNRVLLEDAGNYSCITQNEVGSASHTASLKVMGKIFLEFFVNSFFSFGFEKLLIFKNNDVLKNGNDYYSLLVILYFYNIMHIN